MSTKLPRYALVESEICYIKNERIKVYGIKAINSSDNIFIKDVSSNIEKARNFVNICNLYSVSPLNLEDVLEDYIS